jgi:cob(I)alamin adenosyltransferase
MYYTGKGDNGTTHIYEANRLVSKSDPLILALGGVDELNSLIGVYRHDFKTLNSILSVEESCKTIQQHLCNLQASLVGAPVSLTTTHIEILQSWIAILEPHCPKISSFVLPGITKESGKLDYLRAVTRRVETAVVKTHEIGHSDKIAIAYLNRLSSLWYVLARATAIKIGITEESPLYE